MPNKRKLEIELEHLKKTYRTGIIKTEEYEWAKKKIEDKLRVHYEKVKKENASKQAISDILYKGDSTDDRGRGAENVYSARQAKEGLGKMAKKDSGWNIYRDTMITSDKDEYTEYDIGGEDVPLSTPKTKAENSSSPPIKEESGSEEEPHEPPEHTGQESDSEAGQEKDQEADLEEGQRAHSGSSDKPEKKTGGEKGEDQKKEAAIHMAAVPPAHSKLKGQKNIKAQKKKKENKKISKASRLTKNVEDADRESHDDEKPSSKCRYLLTAILIIVAVAAVMMIKEVDTAGRQLPEKNLSNAAGIAYVELYYSYSCKPCSEAFETAGQIKEVYGGNAEVNYVHFPLDLEEDVIMDNAAECAAEQGQFAEYSKKLFSSGKPLTEEGLVSLAEGLGIDMESFGQCVRDKAKFSVVKSDYKKSLEGAVDTIPSISINGSIISGNKPFEVYEIIMDDSVGLR